MDNSIDQLPLIERMFILGDSVFFLVHFSGYLVADVPLR